MTAEVKFQKGMEIEVKSEEPGFVGSWFTATICRVLPKHGRFSVEYDSLVSESDESKKLKEVVDASNVRPRPPVETHATFEPGDAVDAFHNEGWWGGMIKEAVGDSGFVVHFPCTMEEFEFERPKLRHSRDWIDGKWVKKVKEAAGQEQRQSNDVSNNGKVSIKPTRTEGHGVDGDGQQLIDDTSLWSSEKKVESESLTASESSSQPCKQSKKGEETQGSQLVSKCVKPSIGMEAQTCVSIIVEGGSEANSSEEEQELEKPGRGPKWKNRKASPGKTIEQQTGKKACEWRQQPETNTSNSESLIREHNTLGIVMENDFVEPKFPLNKCNIVARQLSGILDDKAILLSVANEELSQRKVGEPPNNEASKQLNESQLAQTREGNTLFKDIEGQAQLRMLGHSSFTTSMDSQAFGIQSNEAKKKEEDAALQSLVPEIEESKRVTRNKESHAFPPTNDKILATNTTQPFAKSSSVWQMVERMEAFDLLPQHPHFHPLEKYCEEYRQGMALGHMFMFANLVANIHNSQPDDPPTVFEDRLKALTELEGHGFNVKPLQARLKEMLVSKGMLQACSKNAAIIEEEILEREHADDALINKINHIDTDIIKHEQQLVLLHKKRALTLKEKEGIGDEIARLQKKLKVIRDRHDNVKNDFRRLALSPW